MRGRKSTTGLIMLIILIGVPLYLLSEYPWIILIVVAVGAAVIVGAVASGKNVRQVDMSEIDIMSGEEFERYVAVLLRANGFSNVQMTKASGDYGVDVLASKDGERYAIQCKRYAKNVGVKSVQEVYAGAPMYRATRCAVITNMYFSDNGRTLANKLGVKLWDRTDLMRMMANVSN